MAVNSNRRDFDRRDFARDQFGGFHPAVLAWRKTILNNGGSPLSNNTMLSVDWFYRQLKSTSIFDKIKSLNCFVPDNLTAGFTPLIANKGNSVWINHNFISTDLTINGLKGDGASKYLDTGVKDSDMSLTSIGATLYCTTEGQEDKRYFGCSNGVGDYEFVRIRSSANHVQYAAFAQSGNGWVDVANSVSIGYFSGNRISASSMSLYRAYSTQAHTTLGSVAGTGGSLSSVSIYMYNFNSSGSPAVGNYTAKSFSFAAMHDGLSEAESIIFFNLIQLFRTKIGGGFV